MTNEKVENQEVQTQAAQEESAKVERKEVQVKTAPTGGLLQSTVKESYEITQDENGKFARKAVYHPFASITPVTKEEKIAMMNLLNGDTEALSMGDNTGKSFEIADVIFQPYDAIDEDTGYPVYGVLTYIFTHEGEIYVTSSKSVYFTLKKVFQVFGEPHYSKAETVKVQIVKKDGKEHKYVDLKIIG